ncbi:MAG: DUF4936 family protein [Zoogloeaceae bacterium]|nr:DUF4936 family protein [Zoogloeaceae bacterium]
MNLYVYYTVQPDQVAACRAAVRAIQSRLNQPASLLCREDDPATWMEIYEDVGPEFAERLEAEAQQQGFAAFLAPHSRRHLERFVPCA